MTRPPMPAAAVPPPRPWARILPTRRVTLTGTPEEVVYGAVCPHGRDADWRAERIETEMGASRVRVTCLCDCRDAA